jgi:hypothetical protein
MSLPGIDYRFGDQPWPEPPRAARMVEPLRAWPLRASARPSAADFAQAQLFDEILRNELTDVEHLAATIEARLAERLEPRYRKELDRLNARIREVRRLLDALRDRFPAI